MGRKAKAAKLGANSYAANNQKMGMNDDEHNQHNPPTSSSVKQKLSKSRNASIRHSARLRSLSSSLPNQGLTSEAIDVEESEREEELHVEDLNSKPISNQHNLEDPNVEGLNSELIFTQQNMEKPNAEELNSEPASTRYNFEVRNVEGLNSEAISFQQNLEKKIDLIMQSLQELRSKATRRLPASQIQSTDLNYRILYIGAQKKVEALTEENHQLVRKLECANTKVEVYEQICQKLLTHK